MNQFLKRFGKYLEGREVWHQVDLEDRVVRAIMPLPTGDYPFKLWCISDTEFKVSSQVPIRVPSALRATVCDMLEYMNEDMPNGKYKYDLDSNTVYSELSLTVAADDDYPDFVMVYSSYLSDRLFRPLMDMIFLKVTPHSAVVKQQLREYAGDKHEDLWNLPSRKGSEPQQNEEDGRDKYFMATTGLPADN